MAAAHYDDIGCFDDVECLGAYREMLETYSPEEALEKIPFDREEEALRPMVPGSRRLQLMIARTGSCPMCGGQVHDECNAERLGDDLEDGLVYDHQYLCPQCSWSGYEREWIDKPWD